MREKSKLISGLKSEKLLKQPIKFYSDLEKQKITHKKPSNLPTVRKIASARKNGEPALAVNAKNVENQKRRLRLGLAPLLF